MSGQIRQFIAERWRWGIVQVTLPLEKFIREANTRLGRLTETLDRIHERAENGPVPGAYLTIPLYCDTPTLQDGICQTLLPQDFQGLRVIGLTAILGENSDASAACTIDVEAYFPVAGAYSSILTGGAFPVTTAGVLLREAGDFTEPFYAISAFKVDCTSVTNVPKGLMVLLFVKNVGKIEPA